MSEVKIGISARHIHVSREDLDVLFGKGYQLTPFKNLSQPGQYASEEKVTVKNEFSELVGVRILGPVRPETQLELALSDCRKFKFHPPVRNSGDLDGSVPITVVGPKGEVSLDKGTIIANRHIHLSTKDAEEMGLKNGQVVSFEVPGIKGGIMGEVVCRVSDLYALESHIDVDDANAFQIKPRQSLKIIE